MDCGLWLWGRYGESPLDLILTQIRPFELCDESISFHMLAQ
jgi:hypothetical protein